MVKTRHMEKWAIKNHGPLIISSFLSEGLFEEENAVHRYKGHVFQNVCNLNRDIRIESH